MTIAIEKTLFNDYTDYELKKLVLIRGLKNFKEVKNGNKSKSQCSPVV